MKFDAEFPTCREGLFTPTKFATPEQIVDLTVFAEQLGYDALWGTDFVAPAPDYGIPEGENPDWYEPLATIAFCAARTNRVKLGTGLLLAPLRDPVIMAKQVATIDRLSNGRLLLGLGLGMSRDEFRAIRPRMAGAHRGRIMDETIELLQLLLGPGGPVEYDGEYHNVKGVQLHPKPVQDPLPIYVPCRSPHAYDRVARWGLNITAPAYQVTRHLEALGPMLEANGHDAGAVDAIAEGEVLLGATRDAAIERYSQSRHGQFRLARQSLEDVLAQNWIGTTQEVLDELGELKDSGMEHFNLLHIPCDTIEERRELLQCFAEDIMPALR